MKILHLLDHSLPIQSGYSFRSDAILRSLNAMGVATVQLTSPKHAGGDAVGAVSYMRSPRVDGDGPLAQIRCVYEARRALRELVKQERPDVIHAHSPCLNGLAALGLDPPLLYEMRSSWEDAAVASGKTTTDSLRYRTSRWLETQVALRANAVVVICEGLRAELISRGIPANRIHVVGNAIDPEEIHQAPPHAVAELRCNLGATSGTIVLGFFGSYFAWEGLDLLIAALPETIKTFPNLKLVLAGGGEDEVKLKRMVARLSLDGHVHFAGRVEHTQIPAYYAASDLMVFPRRRLKVTDMVTPLKPLEAMHLGTVVLASDVGGHCELIRDGETGYLFRADDVDALSEAIVQAVRQRNRWQTLRDRAREFVASERTWLEMARRYDALYRTMVHR